VTESKTNRRDFLRLATTGTVAAGTAAVVGGAALAKTEAVQDPQSSGYRETEHVKKYYETARY